MLNSRVLIWLTSCKNSESLDPRSLSIADFTEGVVFRGPGVNSFAVLPDNIQAVEYTNAEQSTIMGAQANPVLLAMV